MSSPSSPNAAKEGGSPKAPKAPKAPKEPKVSEVDESLESWIYNIRTLLHFPATIITVAGLLVGGSFIETAPRKSLNFLDNSFGYAFLFLLPLILTLSLDWPTGLLAATVSLIIFARLKKDSTSGDDGFEDGPDHESQQNTKIISNSHRWFVEKVLGETPVAISSDKVRIKQYKDDDSRTSSSSSMSTEHSTSDSAHSSSSTK